jgi:hypothetical protein
MPLDASMNVHWYRGRSSNCNVDIGCEVASSVIHSSLINMDQWRENYLDNRIMHISQWYSRSLPGKSRSRSQLSLTVRVLLWCLRGTHSAFIVDKSCYQGRAGRLPIKICQAARRSTVDLTVLFNEFSARVNFRSNSSTSFGLFESSTICKPYWKFNIGQNSTFSLQLSSWLFAGHASRKIDPNAGLDFVEWTNCRPMKKFRPMNKVSSNEGNFVRWTRRRQIN